MTCHQCLQPTATALLSGKLITTGRSSPSCQVTHRNSLDILLTAQGATLPVAPLVSDCLARQQTAANQSTDSGFTQCHAGSAGQWPGATRRQSPNGRQSSARCQTAMAGPVGMAHGQVSFLIKYDKHLREFTVLKGSPNLPRTKTKDTCCTMLCYVRIAAQNARIHGGPSTATICTCTYLHTDSPLCITVGPCCSALLHTVRHAV